MAQSCDCNGPELSHSRDSSSGVESTESSIIKQESGVIYRVTANIVEITDKVSDKQKLGSASGKADSVSSVTLHKAWHWTINRNQCVALSMLATANLCSTVAFSFIGPFYPQEAKLKGLSESKAGLVFGAFELVVLISAPILGKLMVHMGSRNMFSGGLLITGLSTVAFGFVKKSPSSTLFFLASLGIRIIQAVGDAGFVTASFGILETFSGLGYTFGSMIGAFLYEIKGFELPFFVLGSMLICVGVASYFIFENFKGDHNNNNNGMWGLLRIPVIRVMLYSVVMCAMGYSFLDPTLTDQFDSLHLSTTMIGLMFLLCAGFYTIGTPIWGMAFDRVACNKNNYVNWLTNLRKLLLLGPTPLLHIKKNAALFAIALILLGAGGGALYIPAFQICLESAKLNNYEDSFETHACVSGIFQSAVAFGSFLGPTIGGLLVDCIGFPWTTTILALAFLFFIFALLIYFGIIDTTSLQSSAKSEI